MSDINCQTPRCGATLADVEEVEEIKVGQILKCVICSQRWKVKSLSPLILEEVDDGDAGELAEV